MTPEAKNLLTKMASEYNRTGINSFDIEFYAGIDSEVLSDLEKNGFITISNDIKGSIAFSDELLSKKNK